MNPTFYPGYVHATEIHATRLTVDERIAYVPSTLISAQKPATISGLSPYSNLSDWNEIADVNSNFDNVTGIYTVPEEGFYQISAIINYKLTSPLTTQLTGQPPLFEVVDADTNEVYLSGSLPTLDLNIADLLTLRVVLTNGQVILHGSVNLDLDTNLILRYNSNGFSINSNIDFVNTTLDIVQISEKIPDNGGKKP